MLRWLELKRGNLRGSSYSVYNRLTRRFILSLLGSGKLRDLSVGDVQSWVDCLVGVGVGERSISMAHSILRQALNHSVRLGILDKNPATGVVLPKVKRSTITVWSESEIGRFLVAAVGHRDERLYRLALATGMRRGELLGLMWSDVDWLGSRLEIQRQAVFQPGGGFVFGDPKSDRGIRSVAIGPGVLESLRLQADAVAADRRSCSAWSEFDLVFPSQRGTAQAGSNVDRRFGLLARAAAVPVIRFHDLRHTAATVMLTRGIPPVVVAGMLGHSVGVQLDRYAHFIPAAQAEAAALMDSVVSVLAVDLV